MKFELRSAAYFSYNQNVELLKKYGFTITETNDKFKGVIEGNPKIEINSLDELIALSNEFNSSLILDDGLITIYNGYIE